MTVRARWLVKLAARKALVTAARARHVAHPTAASRALLNKRKKQVLEAEKVLARHPARITTVSTLGVALIQEFEGCKLQAYQDSVGVWTIGYGHTEGVHRGSPSLKSWIVAAALLRADLNEKYAPYVAALHLPLTQHQFDALTSFVYNVGPGGIASSTGVGRALRDHRWTDAADHLLEWDKAGGKTLAGLTRRRQAERQLFLKV